jgi:hypothetical protein
MRRAESTIALAAACALALVGCGGDKQEPAAAEAEEVPAMPFARIAKIGGDPAENGPGDDTISETVPGGLGGVKFPHFTHASNAANGFGVPCRVCHHTTPEGEDPDTGCATCHEVPKSGADPADLGPDDNLWLVGDQQDLTKTSPVIFNHYTHASNRGYKIACERCHHTSDLVQCVDCHASIAKRTDEGAIVPKAKRAFHRLCLACHEALVDSDPNSPAPVDCEGCHNEEGPERLAVHLTLNRAYHISCVGCHQDVVAAKPDSEAPTRDCSGCHGESAAWLPAEAIVAREKLAAEEAAKAKAMEAAMAELADAGVELDPGPETIPFAHGPAKKPTVALSHRAHQSYGACMDCHHKGLKDTKCTGCHKPEEAKTIYHKQCKDGCHKKKGGPTGCKDCHP